MEEKQAAVKTRPFRILTIVFASGLIVILWLQFIFPFVVVSGKSMLPTYQSGDLLVSTRNFTAESLMRNDVIVFDQTGEKKLIKRVVGLPGETVKIDVSGVFIDGERYIYNLPDPAVKPGEEIAFTLESNEFFVLGDNRSASIDSRNFGPVSFDSINSVIKGEFRIPNIFAKWFRKGEANVQ